MAGAVPDKILTPLGGRPVFTHSLGAMAQATALAGIIISYRDSAQMMRLLSLAASFPQLPTLGWAQGGETRMDSVANALAVLPREATAVVIHDAARPFATADAFRTIAARAADSQCATIARRVTDTIKRVGQADARAVAPFSTELEDLERNRLWAMETPQGFPRAILEAAYRQRGDQPHWTDDTAAVASVGQTVTVVELPSPNPKLTTTQDLEFAEWLIEKTSDNEA